MRNPTRPSALAFAETYPNLAPDLPHYPGPVQQWGTPPSDSVKTFLNSGIKLDNGDQIYFFANYANIQTNESFNYRLPKTVTRLRRAPPFANHPAFNNIYLDPCTPTTMTGCPAGGYINDANTFNFNSLLSGRLYAALLRHHRSSSSAPWATRAPIAGASTTISRARRPRTHSRCP